MDPSAVRELLVEHVRAAQRLTSLRPREVTQEETEGLLRDYWARACRLAQIATTEPLPDELRETANAVVRVSRDVVKEVSRRFASSRWSGEWDPDEGRGDNGGAGVPAYRGPAPPARAGGAARDLPPEDWQPEETVIEAVGRKGAWNE
jgi:DNA-directed RNA polymerase subunit H (RpoH/RPB5)